MKAIIVKNNNFETIGFEVKASGRTLFSWGISSELKSNYLKEIEINEWMTEIFELVRNETRISEEQQFVSRFFEIASAQGLLKKGQPVNFSKRYEEIERLKRKRENIIKSII